MQVITLSVGALQTNCYVVHTDDGIAAVIDPGADAADIVRCVHEQGLTVKQIWLTHGHDDHIGAVAALRDAFHCPVVACRAELPILTDAAQNLSLWISGRAVTVQPDLLYGDADTFAFGNQTVQMLHTPGHTAGSCCYLVGDTLFTGDTLFAQSIGRVDFPTGDPLAMRTSLRRLAALDGNFTVYAGHGEKTTLDDERCCNPYMM